jgi:uncharacterized protein (TIGR02271 family)
MSTVELRIRTGAPVQCDDGYLGTVGRLETDGAGNLGAMQVATDRGTVIVPENAIRDVRADGTIVLTPTLAELRPAEPPSRPADPIARPAETLSLREEQLIAHKTMEEVGAVVVRTEIDELPGRLEVEALREEVEVEHVPIGQTVSERRDPWHEDDVLVVPIYEEQLVVTKRLVLREQLRVRRVRVTERQLFEETLRRERAIVDDPDGTGLVRELHPTAPPAESPAADRPLLDLSPQPAPVVDPLLPTPEEIRRATEGADPARPQGSFLDRVVRKALD